MLEKIIKINNPTGLHARPASMIVAEASKFASKITIGKNGKDVNLKSIISLLSLGITYKDEVVIKIHGEDEEAALTVLGNFIESLSE